MHRLSGTSLTILALLFAGPIGFAQDESGEQKEVEKRRDEALKRMLDGVQLVGSFTIERENGERKISDEKYTITKVEKARGDNWIFHCRIQYGDKDVSLPLVLPVKFAGMTPVITLEEYWIPALGKFDAKVLLDGDRYAGTWQHGKVGGLMFGRIVPLSESDSNNDEEKSAELKSSTERGDSSDTDD